MTEKNAYENKCTGCKKDIEYRFRYYNRNGQRYDNNSKNPRKLILEGIKLNTLPDLKKASIFKIALTLYDHINILDIIWQNSNCKDMGYVLREQVKKSLKQLPLPELVKDEISRYVNDIAVQLNDWIWYNLVRIYYLKYRKCDITAIYHEMYQHWRHITWTQDGLIDYKQTAINLLASHRLSDLEKYHMLATYCLKDEIELYIPPSLFASKDMGLVRFADHPLVFYWNCYFTNKMDKWSMNMPADSIARFMFFHDKVDNWPAKEYFFDCISSREQVQCLVSLVNKYYGKYQRLLWMKLNESQRMEFCRISMTNFMENYAIFNLQTDCADDIISTWFEIRSLINAKQFAIIIRDLISYAVETEILETIWTSAFNYFRNYAWYYKDYECIHTALIHWMHDEAIDFFFTLISTSTVSHARQIAMQEFFTNTCVYLINNRKIRMLIKLLNACLPTPKDSMQFRRNFVTGDYFIGNCKKLILEDDLDFLTKQLLPALLPEVEELAIFFEYFTKHDLFIDICENLIVEDKFITLDKLLSSFLPDCGQVLQFKRDLVDNSKSIKIHCLNSYSSGTTEYIDRLFKKFLPLSSSDYVHEFKKNLILSNDGITMCTILYNSGTDITKIIDDSLCDADMSNVFKKKRNLLLSMRRMEI